MERSEAIKLGLKLYNTGRACKHGHFADRYVENGACKLCVRKLVADSLVSLDEKTSQIFLFSQESGFDSLVTMLDSLMVEHCPEVAPRRANPLPISGKRVSSKTYQIKVRVPKGCEDQMRKIGELLREPEHVRR